MAPPLPSTSPDKSCALVTMAIGNLDYTRHTLPVMRDWARREGWEFIVIERRKIRANPNWPRRRFGIHLEKFQLFDILARFDRVLYLDADVLVHPSIPNPFAVVPENAIGGVWDDVGPNAWKREEELAQLAEQNGALPSPTRTGPRFLNAGVLVMSKCHRHLWSFDRTAFRRGRWPEQSLVNYRIQATQTPVFELPETFNFMPLDEARWSKREQRRQAYLVHYASRPAKRRLSEDAAYIGEAWSGPRRAPAETYLPLIEPAAVLQG